jgi:hypothetical protein
MSNFMNNPFNAAAEVVIPSNQQKSDNMMNGFTMNGLNTTNVSVQPASGINSLNNFSMNNIMPSGFGGFSFGAAQNKSDSFTPSSVFAQPINNQLGTKSVEKKSVTQVFLNYF